MVPERDRKEVYDDVLFFLAKKEKVTSHWVGSVSSSFVLDSPCLCSLRDPGSLLCCPRVPAPYMEAGVALVHPHFWSAYNLGMERQEGV